MARPDSDAASTVAEWVAKSARARALALTLEENARTRLADRPNLLKLVRKLRVSASIFERRVLSARMKDSGSSAPESNP